MNDDETADGDDGSVARLLDAFEEMRPVSLTPIFEDGFYKGATATYKNGMTIYHPYIPLICYGIGEDGKITTTTDPYPTKEEYEAGVPPGGLSDKGRLH